MQKFRFSSIFYPLGLACLLFLLGFARADAAISPSVVQYGTVYTGATASYIFPSSVGAKHLLLVAVQDGVSSGLKIGDPTIADTMGNTWIQASPNNWITGSKNDQWIYYAVSTTTGNDTITVTRGSGGSDLGFYVSEWRDVNPYNPINATSSMSSLTTTATPSVGPLTTTVNNAVIFALAGEEDVGSASTSVQSGFSFMNAANTEIAITEYKRVSSRGSYSASITSSISTAYWAMQEVAIAGISGITPDVSGYGPSTLYTGLSGWWTFDGKNLINNVADSSGNNRPMTLNGFTSTTTVPGRVGQALSFDGVSNSASTSAADNLGHFMSAATGTMSAWVYPISGSGSCSSGQASAILNDGTGGGGNVWFEYDGSNLCAGAYNGVNQNMSYAAAPSKWYHLTWVHSLGTVFFYVNGVQVNSFAMGNIASLIWPLWMGETYSTTRHFKGYVDDVRMYNRDLSATEVLELYNATKGGSQAVSNVGPGGLNSGLVGWWTFDGKNTNWATGIISDTSGVGNNGTVVGLSTSTSPVLGKLGQALTFNGTNQYIDLGSGSRSMFGSNSTVSFSFWAKSSNTARQIPVGSYNGSGSNLIVIDFNGYEPACTFTTQTNRIDIQYRANEANGLEFYNTNTDSRITDGKWHHYALTIDKTAGTGSISIDGSPLATTQGCSQTSAAQNPFSQNFFIGAMNNIGTPGIYFGGSLDDVRTYNRILSAGEITQLYGLGR